MTQIGRNVPCPCGSGKKYKGCHLLPQEEARRKRFLRADNPLIVLMPTRGTISVETHIAMVQNFPPVPNVHVIVARKPIDVARNELARAARKIAADDQFRVGRDRYRCLWIDDDAFFAPGTIEALIAKADAHPEIDLLSGCCCARAALQPVAAGIINPEQVRPYQTVETAPNALVDVGFVGFHFATHAASLLERLPADPFTIIEQSEDMEFCRRLASIGGRIAVANDILIPHIETETGEAFLPNRGSGRIVDNQWICNDSRPEAQIHEENRRKLSHGRSYGPAVDAVFDDIAKRNGENGDQYCPVRPIAAGAGSLPLRLGR